MLFNRTFAVTGFDNNNLGHDNSSTVDDLNTSNRGNDTSLYLYTYQDAGPSTEIGEWYLHPSNTGGPSLPYMEVELLGGSNGFPNLDPATAATPLWPANWVSIDERYNSPFYPGMVIPTFSLQPATIPPFSVDSTPLPVPALSRGFLPLSSVTRAGPTSLASGIPQAISNPDDLGFDLPTAAGPSILRTPTVHSSLRHISSHDELWSQIPKTGPSGHSSLGAAHPYPIAGATPPRVPLPIPVASPSGPQHAGRRSKGSTGQTEDPNEDEDDCSWDVALIQFRAKLHEILRNRQTPRGLSSEMTLAAEIAKSVKDDLKRSPLRDTKAREGGRPRHLEDYFTGLLREIITAEPTPTPEQGGSNENETNTRRPIFERLADVLEAKLVAVSKQPVLRKLINGSQTGKGTRLEQTEGRVKKNKCEKSKRDCERHHLERISCLFKVADPSKTWTRVDVLIFSIVFLLRGPRAFSPGFVKVASIPRGL